MPSVGGPMRKNVAWGSGREVEDGPRIGWLRIKAKATTSAARTPTRATWAEENGPIRPGRGDRADPSDGRGSLGGRGSSIGAGVIRSHPDEGKVTAEEDVQAEEHVE